MKIGQKLALAGVTLPGLSMLAFLGYMGLYENCERFHNVKNSPEVFKSVDKCRELELLANKVAEKEKDVPMQAVLEKMEWCNYPKILKKIWHYDRDSRIFLRYLDSKGVEINDYKDRF